MQSTVLENRAKEKVPALEEFTVLWRDRQTVAEQRGEGWGGGDSDALGAEGRGPPPASKERSGRTFPFRPRPRPEGQGQVFYEETEVGRHVLRELGSCT